ncbi:amidase domain-containing protein [Candidatus Formimonas warabiya]|uniref:Putative amidase domain-containing protein n=1 Tax=Formimonas warabiya TaxID=1761012 RepID=A0A3G1KNU5_FORW1|nr:amidase domain-containing protein [Candidatus Formimonas warabiya]ATW24090.1 hypothetical protein DCMF_04205 [Candidatus Formimonas warabiya]
MQRENMLPVVQELFNWKNSVLLTGNLVHLERLYSGDSAAQKSLEKEKKVLSAKQRSASARNAKYIGHVTQVYPGRVIRSGNVIKMNVNEIITWGLIEFGRLRYERQQNFHELTLEYQGQWLIKTDFYRLEAGVATIPRPVDKNLRYPGQPRNTGTNVFRGQKYDRAAAVRYAQKWWNNYNPSFHSFSVDCTNYVSQVLYAGGIPMTYTGKANTGWWYSGSGTPEDKWSYSWTVAHSLRWYLASGKGTLRAEPADSAQLLLPGDVICYDWDGDGVWQHNTVVVGLNGDGQPLVNAHTNNSQNRYWDYQDSLAWTEKTKYLFWRILS